MKKLNTGNYWDIMVTLTDMGADHHNHWLKVVDFNYKYTCGCVRFHHMLNLDELKELIDGSVVEYNCYFDEDGDYGIYVESAVDSICPDCDNKQSSANNSPSDRAIDYLIHAIKLVVDQGEYMDLKASELTTLIEHDILDSLVEYCRRNSNFAVCEDIELVDDWDYGSWGGYSYEEDMMYLNDKLVYGLVASVGLDVGEFIVSHLVETVLHELRHAYQHYNDLRMVHVPYVSPSVDYEAYWNHPMEVDARLYASEYADDAMGFTMDRLRRKYLSHLYTK